MTRKPAMMTPSKRPSAAFSQFAGPIFPELHPHHDLYTQEHIELGKKAKNSYEQNVQSGVPFITPELFPDLMADTKKIAIIGGGKTLDKNALNKDQSVIKVITGGTHGMVERGELTDVTYAVIGFASAQGMLSAYQNPRKDITYFVAAQADPEIVKSLKNAGAKVYLYNAYVPGVKQNPKDLMGIGCTSATSALAVFAGIFEKKEFIFHGVDSSTKYADAAEVFEANEVKRHGFAVDKTFYERQTMDLKRFQKANQEEGRGITMEFSGESIHSALFNADYVRKAPMKLKFPGAMDCKGPFSAAVQKTCAHVFANTGIDLEDQDKAKPYFEAWKTLEKGMKVALAECTDRHNEKERREFFSACGSMMSQSGIQEPEWIVLNTTAKFLGSGLIN